jgi:preprotein translocase subunit SecA
MSILNSILKVFVGDKNKKDLKALQPIVAAVHAFESELSAISNDELRAKTVAFKEKIKTATLEEENQLAALKEELNTANVDRKEEIYESFDALEKSIYEKAEIVLNDIQAEAYAVIKETAKRFTSNKELEVTATPFDRELSAKREHILLEENKALWQNSWDAAGNLITWNMVHYDVQLIGGSVLHSGKIAEMMTG